MLSIQGIEKLNPENEEYMSWKAVVLMAMMCVFAAARISKYIHTNNVSHHGGQSTYLAMTVSCPDFRAIFNLLCVKNSAVSRKGFRGAVQRSGM